MTINQVKLKALHSLVLPNSGLWIQTKRLRDSQKKTETRIFTTKILSTMLFMKYLDICDVTTGFSTIFDLCYQSDYFVFSIILIILI